MDNKNSGFASMSPERLKEAQGKADPKKRGFAVISPERQKEIASMGGKAAHAKGTAHQYTKEEASIAGKKGGIKSGEARARKAGLK